MFFNVISILFSSIVVFVIGKEECQFLTMCKCTNFPMFTIFDPSYLKKPRSPLNQDLFCTFDESQRSETVFEQLKHFYYRFRTLTLSNYPTIPRQAFRYVHFETQSVKQTEKQNNRNVIALINVEETSEGLFRLLNKILTSINEQKPWEKTLVLLSRIEARIGTIVSMSRSFKEMSMPEMKRTPSWQKIITRTKWELFFLFPSFDFDKFMTSVFGEYKETRWLSRKYDRISMISFFSLVFNLELGNGSFWHWKYFSPFHNWGKLFFNTSLEIKNFALWINWKIQPFSWRNFLWHFLLLWFSLEFTRKRFWCSKCSTFARKLVFHLSKLELRRKELFLSASINL